MADGLFTVLLFGMVMAIASFAAGMLPLAITLSQSQIRLMSTIGMGVLVGTSLIVIIPEGIETLYSVPPIRAVARSTSPSTGNSAASFLPSTPGLDTRSLHTLPSWFKPRSVSPESQLDDFIPSPPAPKIEAPTSSPSTPASADSDSDDEDHDHEDGHGHSHETNGAHKYVGISLIAGFILMYLIDVLPASRKSGAPEPYHIALDNLRSISPPPSSGAPSKPNALTLGLVIHAAADGIALGASSTADSVSLSVVIFLAIMLHKAPAAFGLTAVLLRSGIAKQNARKHLVVFSLAAPVGALVTWAVVTMAGATGGGMQWWTGVLLLFSGGTFLYVAMHTMQDHLVEYGHNATLKDVGAAVFGMVIPLVTQVGHAHAH